MKRLSVTILILITFLFMIASCAPADSSIISSYSSSPSSSNNGVEIINPSMFLVDDQGTKTYAVYYFINKNGENCVVIADNYVASDTNSNSTPVIHCK